MKRKFFILKNLKKISPFFGILTVFLLFFVFGMVSGQGFYADRRKICQSW